MPDPRALLVIELGVHDHAVGPGNFSRADGETDVARVADAMEQPSESTAREQLVERRCWRRPQQCDCAVRIGTSAEAAQVSRATSPDFPTALLGCFDQRARVGSVV